MRVLIWSEGFPPHRGGVSVIAPQFVTAMRQRGVEFTILTSLHPQRPRLDEFHGIPVHRFPFSSMLVQRNLKEIAVLSRQVAEIKKQFQPHLVHTYEYGVTNFFDLTSDPGHRLRKLFTVQSTLPASSNRSGMVVQMLRSADWVTTVSQAILDDIRQLVPQMTPRTSLIHNGLCLPPSDPAPLTADAFAAPVLVCAGRVVRDKGFDVALEALPNVLDKFPSARLIIAGDGDQTTVLEQRAVELGVRHAVEFTGWISPEQVCELMNRSTIVVMPSRWREPFGLVALQAAQMARPIVATRVGGLSEVVAEGETGLLVESENPSAFAEAILSLLEHPKAAQAMGRQARERALEKFSMDRYADEYEELYRKLARPE